VSPVEFTVGPTGHLVVRSRRRRTVALRLQPEGAEVGSGTLAPVLLQWSEYRALGGLGGPDDADGWRLGAFSHGRGGPFGIAVLLGGHCVAACHDLWRATMPRHRRYQAFWQGTTGRLVRVLPIMPSSSAFTRCERERTTLEVLGSVVHERSDVRGALESAWAAAQLANDLSEHLLGPPKYAIALHRDEVDIEVARIAAGFVHRYGRPLPGDPMPSLEGAVAEVRRRLANNRYRHDRDPVDDAVIARWLRRNFFDVEPWPFGALLT
jgi:hypothetical protein